MPPSWLGCGRQDQMRKEASQDSRAERDGEPRSKLNPFAWDRFFALGREQTWT